MLSLSATLQQLYWKCESKSQAITCVDKKTVLYEKELTEVDQFRQLRMSKDALNLVKPQKVQKCCASLPARFACPIVGAGTNYGQSLHCLAIRNLWNLTV